MAGVPLEDREVSARRIFTRVAVFGFASSCAGAAMLWFDIVVFYPVYPAADGLGRVLALVAVAAVPYYVVAGTLAYRYGHRRFVAGTSWYEEDRPPREAELDELTALPGRVASHVLLYWIGSFVWTMPYLYFVAGYRPGVIAMTKMSVAFAFAALVAWTLTYVTIDRTLRPLRALALSSGSVVLWPRTMGVFPRLLLVWIVVAMRPLVETGGMLVGLGPRQLERVVPVIWLICALSLIGGIIVTALSSRSITDPLARLRRGFLAVEGGSLDAEVPVDEAGEIGELQIGFNRMLVGLRERERMRDLFGRYVGTPVLQHALDAETHLGGETLETTVLFADIVSSTRLAESRAPDDVVALLNSFFGSIVEAVDPEGGFVSSFEGDGALCVFGAPNRLEDHAGSALRAALRLREGLASLFEESGIAAGVGVSSGPVVAGNVGTLDRHEFTVIGDPVNEAARLTEAAKLRDSRMLVSGATVLSCRTPVEGFRLVGALSLRGRLHATRAYEPTALMGGSVDGRDRFVTP